MASLPPDYGYDDDGYERDYELTSVKAAYKLLAQILAIRVPRAYSWKMKYILS